MHLIKIKLKYSNKKFGVTIKLKKTSSIWFYIKKQDGVSYPLYT